MKNVANIHRSLHCLENTEERRFRILVGGLETSLLLLLFSQGKVRSLLVGSAENRGQRRREHLQFCNQKFEARLFRNGISLDTLNTEV